MICRTFLKTGERRNDTTDKYQKLFARWVNNKKLFNRQSWEDYSDGRLD